MLGVILVALMTGVTAGAGEQRGYSFPKRLWTYWNGGEVTMKLFTRLCVHNMAYYAKKSGWEFHLVTDETLSQFVSLEGLERMNRMLTESKHHLGMANRADIIRLFLLSEHGGMWLDTNSFLLGTLDWVQ